MPRLLLDSWQVVIGIETHAQIKSRLKLFSKAYTAHLDHSSNTRYNVFDASFPGTLPRLNRKCIDLALRAALALNCTVQKRSSFDRKHYFYSDQPVGYQITQHYAPFALNGRITLPKFDLPVRIKQIQLEQDTAKSTFNPRTKTSNIDLNRAGTGLLEIVTEPDLRSPEEAAEYVRTLQALLRAVGVSDGNMEAGSLRCDINVSINRPGEPPGTRCEIKNLNSIKYMVAAIKHEIDRQKAILTSNDGLRQVPQETRGFDQDRWETFKLRSKEDAPDYRYMPDPNLGVLIIEKARIEETKSNLPVLPSETRARLLTQYKGLTENNVDILLNLDANRELNYDGDEAIVDGQATLGAVAYFEELCRPARNPKVVINWMTQNLLGQLSSLELAFSSHQIPASRFGELIDLVTSGQLTRPTGKLLLKHMLTNDIPVVTSVKELAQELDMLLVPSSKSTSTALFASSEDDALHQICLRAIDALPSEIAAIKAGNSNVMNKVIGWVMRESKGKADVKRVREIINSSIQEIG
ncbi:glutamyl-tRNA amidotransferase [Dendrothele bispora CBS 962.96]|uniref:Glutamyl-tRNA(Gln) amidotransferase subunit B, mitochondrial n=1 Tax=Dendrothele bispora (strain CBS 962.96) TaxID=1314807 RepID=A0A4S8MQY3_DENBC|nr:glutamyl-tRNA amidotransferase [Dendrothele bispora CBS 962.96]